MSDSIFEQNFVFCAICHQKAATGNPLILTSCAHILCDKHFPKNDICPICKTNDFSTISLTDEQTLPNDVKIFFQPLPTLLESIYNASIFQINGLNEQVYYYQSHCIKLREKVARQQQLLYQAKNELDRIPLLKQKIQKLEDSVESLTRNITNTSKNETPVNGSNVNGTKYKISSFFNKKSNSSFGLTSKNSYTQAQPPPTVDLTIDSDDYDEQQQQFISKLKQSQNLRHHGQKSLQYQGSPKVKEKNNRNLYNSNKRNVNIRANTVGLGSNEGRNINNKGNFRINNNNDPNSFKSYDDLAVAESTQINKLNSSSDYISQPKQNTLSPEQTRFKSGIQSPGSIYDNKKNNYYYPSNDKQYYKNNISLLNNNKTNLITPPENGLSRRRMSSALVSGRIQFPTPLEKLKIGKKKPITSNSPTNVQYLKRRSVTSQLNSPNNSVNNIGKTQSYRGRTSMNNYR